MAPKKNKPLFTIRRIANRNPRLARFCRDSKQKIWRLAVVVFLVIVGVASLFFFESGLVGQNFDSNLLSADAAEAKDILGPGFEEITRFDPTAENPSLDKKSEGFKAEGIGTINAVLYNIKDYFKYIAGSAALLYLVIAAIQIIVARNEEGIKKGKENLFWSILALVSIFAIDLVIVAFFEGGGSGPGQSLVIVNNGTPTESLELMKTISLYVKTNARTIFSYLKTIVGASAILFVVFAGLQMVTAGGAEEKIEKEKKYIIHILTAFVTILMLDAMIFGVIYPDNKSGESDPICVELMNYTSNESLNSFLTNAADLKQFAANYGLSTTQLNARIANCNNAATLGAAGTNQVLGVIRFFETLVGAIAIFFIVYSGTSIIASMGNDEIIKKHKTTLFWSVIGLVIVIISNAVIMGFFFVVEPETGEASVVATNGIQMIAGITNFVAGFIGIFSVVSMVVAGGLWVVNFGNDELASKAKKVILSAIIGVVIAVSAYSVVNTITNANSRGGTGTSIGVSI